MRTLIATSVLAAVAAGLLWAAEPDALAVKSSNDIAVVVHPMNVVDSVTLSDLTKILRGDRKFWNGKTPVTIVLRAAGTPEHDHVLAAVVHMSDGEFKEHWIGKVFRGEASAEPIIVPSDGLASEYVSTNMGAVAFMPGINVRGDLKVLKIDGKLPGQAGYPLK
ncbi:MAG TPA: hypothetical protein VG498_05690 [Terriglobales bacterium]|nr:hypothetical protein [Terriglobales bacterium]